MRISRQKLFSIIEYLKAPDYKTFLKENPKAAPVDKLVKLYPKVLALSRKYKVCDVPYAPDPDVDVVWNTWVESENDLYWREYYPVLSWTDDNYHSDLYFHIPTSTWIEIDGDVTPKEGYKYKTPLDWVAYHTYCQFYSYDEYDLEYLENVEEFFSEFCKIVGLKWEVVKKGGPKIIQGRYDPKNPKTLYQKKIPVKPKLGENLKWGAISGGIAGYLGSGLVSKVQRLQDGDDRIGYNAIKGIAAGTAIGSGIGAYKYYKDKLKYNRESKQYDNTKK